MASRVSKPPVNSGGQHRPGDSIKSGAPTRFSKLMKRIWRERFMYLLILPGAFYYCVFTYLPMLGNVVAFQDYSPFRASREGPIRGFLVGPWVGFDNFTNMFSDPDFLTALSNTVQIEILLLLFAFPAPLILALLLNSLVSHNLKRTMQTIVYLPHFLSWVIIVSMWRQFFGGTGMVNEMLGAVGAGSFTLFDSPSMFKPVVVIQAIWKDIGWGTIIYLAALTKIDVSLYEAAVVDGAGGWRRLRDVTLPGIRPVVVILLILTIGNAFSVGFEQFFLQRDLYGSEQAEVLDTFGYFRGIQAGDYGFATAVGMVKSVVGLVLIVGANWFAKRIGDEGII